MEHACKRANTPSEHVCTDACLIWHLGLPELRVCICLFLLPSSLLNCSYGVALKPRPKIEYHRRKKERFTQPKHQPAISVAPAMRSHLPLSNNSTVLMQCSIVYGSSYRLLVALPFKLHVPLGLIMLCMKGSDLHLDLLYIF